MTPDASRPHPPACTRKQRSSAPAAPATRPAGRSTFPGAGIELPCRHHGSAGHRADSRAYSRTDATPTWEALETAVGQVEGGHAVAFSSGMAAIAAVLDLLPAGAASSPRRTATSGSASCSPTPGARALGRRPR